VFFAVSGADAGGQFGFRVVGDLPLLIGGGMLSTFYIRAPDLSQGHARHCRRNARGYHGKSRG
jgi:hypothetical protein